MDKEVEPVFGIDIRQRSWPPVALLSIYKLYPRKMAKAKAICEIRGALNRICDGEIDGKDRTMEEAIEYLRGKTEEALTTFAGRDKKYIPHPTTYYHQSRYLRPAPQQADVPTRFDECA